DELFSDDMEGQASGMIANVAPAPEGGYDVLAVLQTASVEGYKLRTANNTELNILPLPYTLA
ncbi:MAG: folate-binding protein, partial [Gallionella sp.]